MIYILTGNGKGKTTSAIGMGIRAVGAKKKVLMIQFLKVKNSSSENKVISKIKNFDLKSFGREGFFVPKNYLAKHPRLKKLGIRELTGKDFKLAREGFDLAKKVARKYNLLILDEICIALKFGLIKKKEVLDFLKDYGLHPPTTQNLDIVLTGRYCPKEIIKIADLVTEFKEIKHYFKKGQKARKGVEY